MKKISNLELKVECKSLNEFKKTLEEFLENIENSIEECLEMDETGVISFGDNYTFTVDFDSELTDG